MREIKFRAWDKRNKKWFHPDLIIMTTAGFYEDHREFEDGNSLFDYEYELMQYTGLEDKNGKRIYEGDIIEWDEKEWGMPYREVAEWNYELLHSRENDWKQFCIVIGNIYENPELITP